MEHECIIDKHNSNFRIMIADDSESALFLLEEILTRHNYSVYTYLSGELLLKAVDEVMPTLIILDMMMPQMDGINVCRVLKSNDKTKSIPVVFISALDDFHNKTKALRAGAVDFITKPINNIEVLARIDIHVQIFALQQSLLEKNNELQLEIQHGQMHKKALLESESKYRSLFDLNPQPMWVCALEGLNFLNINQAAIKHYGFSIDEFLQMSLSDIQIEGEYGKLTRNNETVDGNKALHRTKKGDLINVEIQSHVLDYDGVQAVLMLAIDVTEKIKIRQELEDNFHLFQGLFNSSPDAIMLIDPHDQQVSWPIVDCNKAACVMNGFSREELIGKTIDILHADNQTKEDHDRYFKHLQEEKTIYIETTHLHKDGHIIPLEVLTTIVKLGGKEYILGIDRDITERNKVQRELIEAKQKAEDSDRLKTAFLSNMSHEIRTPLNSILGFSELLVSDEIDEDQRSGFAEMITTSGENLLAIINDIIDISKIESGLVNINIHSFDAQKLISSILKEFERRATQHGLLLRKLSGNSDQPLIIQSDEGKIYQVLANFVGNAIKFTDSGVIEVGVKDLGDHLKFMVVDTGIGIPYDLQKNIFERFRQVENAFTRKIGGNGLGLAISKNLIELLGGEIGLISENKKGSTFYFVLPK